MKCLNKYMMAFLVATCALFTTSCEKDNYDEPEAAIMGQITDQEGNPLQLAVGKNSMSIRVIEKSYAHGDESITVTPQDLNLKQDGSFENIHLFAGTYSVSPWQGPFYENDAAALTEEVQLKSGKTTTVNFKVTPYLKLEWVKEPYIDPADGKLKASFKFHQNEKEGMDKPALLDYGLWISRTQYCGTEGEPNLTPPVIKFSAEKQGDEITVASKSKVSYAIKYYVRFGARCKDKYQKYIFTDIKTIDVTGSQIKK